MKNSWFEMSQQELQKKFLALVEEEHGVCLPEEITVLGRKIKILYCTSAHYDEMEDCEGVYSHFERNIRIDIEPWLMEEGTSQKFCNFTGIKKVLRHEIVHAFFYCSGLSTQCDYASNEELVDWIAAQLPEMANSIPKVIMNETVGC